MKLYFLAPEFITQLERKRCDAGKNWDNMADYLSLYVNQREEAYVENSIGYIHIYGCLLSDCAPIDEMLGNTSYENIIDDIEEVLEMGAQAIVFVIDSPGGTVEGAIECAELIRDLPVPTVGFIKGQGCSAAYKLASATSYIISTKSSSVGNIGAIIAMMDTTGMYDDLGVKIITFVNQGAVYKSIGYDTSLSQEQSAFLQDSINRTGTMFQQFVMDNRPEINPEVWKAGWYDGLAALDLGLVDEVANDTRVVEFATSLVSAFGTSSNYDYESL